MTITRRSLLLSSLPLIAGDFWDSKRYSQWDEREVARMLSDSPWSKRSGGLTIRWASALPVQMAIARRNQGSLSVPMAARPMKDYVITVEGLPISELPSDRMDRRMVLFDAGRLHARRMPAVVADDVRVVDGLVEFHFPKDQPVTLKNREVDFGCKLGGVKARCKFMLAEMMFEGQLAL